MIAYCRHNALQLQKTGLLSLVLSFYFFGSAFTQNHNHAHCVSEQEISCTKDVELAFENLKNNTQFKSVFFNKFNIDYVDFITWNNYEKQTLINYISNTVCYGNKHLNSIGTTLLEVIERTQDNYWFSKPKTNPDLAQVGKHQFLEQNSNGNTSMQNIPKTAACLNADFETGDHTGWSLFCGTVTGTSMGGTTSETTNCAGQHSVVTGGTDAFTQSPRVFQGGVSAMLGDGTGTGSRYARLRKDFVVSATNPAITYSYMAVLQDPGTGHGNAERPFFSARVYVNGTEIGCAQYFSHFGDGQAGWITGGGVAYRDWTSIFVPLEAYINETVTLEITVGDCSQSGHWGYAYVDVSCDNMEVEQFCEGSSTVLKAPTDGIQAWEWSTGETTSQITVTTPGTYTVNVLPYGSICSALLTYNASIYPAPTADFSISANPICVGGDIDFTNNSTVESGGTITGYHWNFGDGISTPDTLLGSISGVTQTTGTYTDPNHVYNVLGSGYITMTVKTSDGCSASAQVPLSVIEGPEATITGDTVVCYGDGPPEVTFTGSLTPGPYTFFYNIDNGPTQSVSTSPGNSSVTVPVPTTPDGTYVYNLTYVVDSSTAQCEREQLGTVTILVNPLPTATISGTTTLCQDSPNPQITFTGNGGDPGTDYEFTYAINGGVPQTVSTSGSNSVTVNVPTSVATTYTYTLHSVTNLSTNCSQSQTGSAVITINPRPIPAASGDIVVCQNDTPLPQVTFTGHNSTSEYAFSYNVNNGPLQTVTTSGTNTTTVTQSTTFPGIYEYEVTNVMDPATFCNRDTSIIVTIEVKQLPVASISAPVEACHMSTTLPEVTFTGSGGQAPYTFEYTINGGATQYATSTGNSVTIQVPTNIVGQFIYTITNIEDGSSQHCSQAMNVSTMATINPLPDVSAGDDFTVCAGTTIVLTGSGAQSYVWDNGVTNGVSFTATETTTYSVEGTDYKGCKNTDDITVTVIPIPVMDIAGQNLSGCSPVVPLLTNNSTGNLTNCTWYLGNGEVLQGCGSVSSVFNDPGCFDVTLVVATPEGCSNSMTLQDYICVDPKPIADFYPKPSELTTYNWESQMVNESVGAINYQWDFGDGSGYSYSHSPTHAFPNDVGGIYTVRLVASTENGCVDTAYATVTVKEELIFYVPNTFTPDNDDYNETFKPVFTTGFDPYHYTLYIFNRWGELIFESHDTNIGWNGKYGVDGKMCQDGTYTWKISVKKRMVDEHMEFIGHINLIR